MNAMRTLGLVLLGLPLLACDPLEPSDAGQYGIQIDLLDLLGRNSRRVLVGTEFEARPTTAAVPGQAESLELDLDNIGCVPISASGSLSEAGAFEFLVTEAGPGAIELGAPAANCPDDEQLALLEPDRWSMIGVEADAVTGAWVVPDEGAAFDWNTSPGPAGQFPPAFGRPLDELLVVAGAEFAASPVLLDPLAGSHAEVRFSASDATLTVPERYRELASYVDSEGELEPRLGLVGTLAHGESVSASLDVLGHSVALPKAEAVPVERIASLEVVPVYWPGDAEREWGPPAGAVAIARDAEGQRIIGVPVEWSVTRGRLFREQATSYADVISVGDCKATPRSPQWRGATLEIALGDLVASADLEWIALPSDETDPSSELCTGSACSCSTSPRPADSLLAGLGLLVLGAGLRRRQSKRETAASTAPR